MIDFEDELAAEQAELERKRDLRGDIYIGDIDPVALQRMLWQMQRTPRFMWLLTPEPPSYVEPAQGVPEYADHIVCGRPIRIDLSKEYVDIYSASKYDSYGPKMTFAQIIQWIRQCDYVTQT